MNQALTHGSLCSGIGGFDLGAEKAGVLNKWSCELEEYPRNVLAQNFPHVSHYGDIKDIKSLPEVDIISAGFPCQNISIAGDGTGIKGDQSSLWEQVWRICRNVRPSYVIIENSSMLAIRGFERVLFDLSQGGYYAEWQCLSGKTFGVQQGRERLYCIAYTSEISIQRGIEKKIFQEQRIQRQSSGIHPGWRTRRDIPTPRTIRSTNDLPNLVDRIKACGNAVMPRIAHCLFELISDYHFNK